MAQTSINVRPVKPGSELHNERKKRLDYIRPDLSKNNESWKSPDFRSIQEEQEHIKADYALFHKKKMHSKATPIREAVLVIKEDTSIDQIREACKKMEELNGIKVMQIHIHKDEGHRDESGEWKPNLHAHIVFCWYNFEEHTTCKLNKVAMMDMQTVFARCLEMERGESSDRKHLNAVQQKNKAEAEKLQRLQEKTEQQAKEHKAELLQEAKDLRKSGKQTVKAFDYLCAFEVEKPSAKEQEHRDRLEQECSRETPTSTEELSEYVGRLRYHLMNTINAVTKIGKKLNAIAMNIPLYLFKKKRLRHEAELLKKASEGEFMQKKAQQAILNAEKEKSEASKLKEALKKDARAVFADEFTEKYNEGLQDGKQAKQEEINSLTAKVNSYNETITQQANSITEKDQKIESLTTQLKTARQLNGQLEARNQNLQQRLNQRRSR